MVRFFATGYGKNFNHIYTFTYNYRVLLCEALKDKFGRKHSILYQSFQSPLDTQKRRYGLTDAQKNLLTSKYISHLTPRISFFDGYNPLRKQYFTPNVVLIQTLQT